MPIELTGSKGTFQQNEKLSLEIYHSYKSTKINQNKPGRWYYEFTHYSGNQYHLAGFKCDSGTVSFYMCGVLSMPQFYFLGDFATNKSTYMPFALQNNHTVGLGIDTYKNIFYVFYENNFAYKNFSASKPIKNLNVKVWGASINKTNDEISVNFGATPFKYNISGFTPWENNNREKTCYQKMSKHSNSLINIMLLVLFSK